ncbi:MAG TPA: efflux RND transporter periplasmic adaptor subunit [Usitatibacter sp.]|jgi:RND family efflux transporter MFP subunit|nr:efflux RND transporter periplasmic adaptor subunit [Usitatibacter sp.]
MPLPRTRHLKPILAVVTVAVVVGSLVGFRATQARKDEEKKPGTPVTLEFTPADLAVVEVRSLVRSIAFSGSLAPMVQTTVKSKVPGEVNRVMVREGETVAAGQVLAQIDTADLQARLDAQAAALQEAKARLSIADKNRANNQQLLRQKFISQNAYDTAQSTYEAAVAAVNSQEAQLRIAQRAMDDAVVRAPFAGIVARRMANAGEKVNVDSPLFSLVDLGRMEIEAPAPAFEVPSIRTGQAASFRVDGFGERVFDGRVERINPVADAGSRAITLYISVANRDGALKGGMFAKGQIVLGEARAAPVVPASAIREESGQSFVYTLENGKIGRRAVQVGFTEPQLGLVEIQSGLEQGLNVVSARVAGLKAGAPAVLKPAVASAPQRKG